MSEKIDEIKAHQTKRREDIARWGTEYTVGTVTIDEIDFLLAEAERCRDLIARLCRNLDEHIITTRRAAEQCLKNVQPMRSAENAIFDARVLLGEDVKERS